MARWTAQYHNRVPGFQNQAANLGTTVHAALEHYVRAVYMEKSEQASLKLLISLFEIYYSINFGADRDESYAAGVKMLKDWFARNDLSDRTVLSVESKEFFDVPTSAGPIKFNFIIDRLDQLEEDVY